MIEKSLEEVKISKSKLLDLIFLPSSWIRGFRRGIKTGTFEEFDNNKLSNRLKRYHVYRILTILEAERAGLYCLIGKSIYDIFK